MPKPNLVPSFRHPHPPAPTAAQPRGTRFPKAQKVAATIIKPYFYLECGFAFDSHLFTIARMLVRLAAEKTKPNSDRLGGLPRFCAQFAGGQDLYSEAPIYSEFEEARLVHSLGQWKKLMPDDPLARSRLARPLGGRGGQATCGRPRSWRTSKSSAARWPRAAWLQSKPRTTR